MTCCHRNTKWKYLFFQVTMMAEGSGLRIKQEIETTCCSPSPSSGSGNQPFVYNTSQSNVQY